MSGLFFLSILLLPLCNAYVISDSECTDATKIYYIPNPANCSEYFECVRGTKFLESCPGGLVWDQINHVCDYNDYVGCIPTTTPATTTTSDPICPPTGTTNVYYPYDCGKYYQCVDGKKTIKTCPENLYFDPATLTCIYMDLVDCTITPTPTPDTTSSTTTSSTTTSTTTTTTTESSVTNDPLCPSTETMDVFYPYDCSKYYHCVNGQKTLKICPENLYFNPVTAGCDYMDVVDCDVTTTSSPSTETTQSESTSSTKTTPSSTTTTTTTTENPDDICKGQPNGTYLPDPASCRRFYECANEMATALTCPGGTIWDESIIACVNSDSDCI